MTLHRERIEARRGETAKRVRSAQRTRAVREAPRPKSNGQDRYTMSGHEVLVAASIDLPWPPAELSGHNKGHWRDKAGIVAKHRLWAKNATLAAKTAAPARGDIKVIVVFYPPDKRGDRVNYPNRLKPYFDGIAEALGVNDNRFLPSYHFGEPVKNGGKVVIGIEVAP